VSSVPTGPGETDTRDGEILADLFDALLQEILEGNTPDLTQYYPDRPDLRERIAKTWALACSVAGRREPSRPVMGGYEIVRELGHGGMGTVYLARHQALQREVAIKVLPHSLAMSPRAKQRFLEEAKALARLKHDHVVHIHRIIDHAEMLAFEMEFVDGPSLQTLILELRNKAKPHSTEALAEVLGVAPAALGTRSSVEWFVRTSIQIARALAEVHRHGLVHRDVKPSNILLRKDGRPVLADFGLARLGDLDATQVAGFAGTPVYAAPERLRDGDANLDPRADVYSLAVSLYEALTLQPPFAGSTTHEVLRRIESGNLPALRKQAPHVSRDLETVLEKAMEVDPKHRYATADAFADDLERLLSLQPIFARPAGPLRATAKLVRRHQRVVLSALAGALLVAGLTWPALVHASAAGAAREQALAATYRARMFVLSPETLQVASARAFLGTSRQPLRHPSAVAAQLLGLEQAMHAYDEALLADPAAEQAGLERDVLATVYAIRSAEARATTETEPAPENQPPLRRPPTTLPPLTQTLSRTLAAGRTPGDLASAIAGASPRDRFAAGLLCFLFGDHHTSDLCWNHLETELSDQPLLDACSALQLAGDGFPERAYPRLFHAARAFPTVVTLAMAMADSALAMGDIQLAENWLRSLPADLEHPFAKSRRLLLEADLLAATNHESEAARSYRELSQQDPTDPVPIQRLASLAIEQGNQASAKRLLNTIVLRWPDLAAPRLELARLALIRRNLAGYLDQARYVMSQDLGQMSRGTASQLAEILRIGGLRELLSKMPAEEPLRTNSLLRASAMPLADWLPKHSITAIKRGLEVIAALDAGMEQARATDMRELGIALRGIWHATCKAPSLRHQLPVQLQLGLLGGIPLLLGDVTDAVTMWLVPYTKSLGTPLLQLPLSPLVAVETDLAAQIFANDLVLAGDTDGDTLLDLVVACPPSSGEEGTASVEIRSLHDGSLLRTLTTERKDVMFGRSVAVLGDIDGDLCNDILVGSPKRQYGDEPPVVELYSGRTGKRIWSITRDIFSFGVSMARLGDLDGDGFDDFVVGASTNQITGAERGRAFVCSGATGAELHELQASRSGVWFGGHVANAGDVDGDGKDDILVGGNYGNAPGLVTLYSGHTGESLLTFGDDAIGPDYGFRVCGTGDADGDGRPDLAISAPSFTNRTKAPGRVQILSSKTGKVIVELQGEQRGEGFGSTLCALENWTRRSGGSLAVAARRGGPIGAGYVRIFRINNGSPEQTFTTGTGTAVIGHSMASIGDTDGDGYPELLVPSIARNGRAIVCLVNFRQTIPSNRR
jgi:hypothetical protein